MIIKVEAWRNDNERVGLTILTDNLVHSMLSDNPDLQEVLTDSIQSVLNELIRREKANEKTNNQDN